MLETAQIPTLPSSKKLCDCITKWLLPHHEDAIHWLKQFEQVCHLLDDVIDEGIVDAEVQLKLHQMTISLYSSDFYHTHRLQLYPLVTMTVNVYADSVIMERCDINSWQYKMHDGIRNVSNETVSHIVGMLCGWDAKREVSMLLREDSYFHHHDKEGNPI